MGGGGLVLPPEGAARSGNLDSARDLLDGICWHLTGPPEIPSLFSLSMGTGRYTNVFGCDPARGPLSALTGSAHHSEDGLGLPFDCAHRTNILCIVVRAMSSCG